MAFFPGMPEPRAQPSKIYRTRLTQSEASYPLNGRNSPDAPLSIPGLRIQPAAASRFLAPSLPHPCHPDCSVSEASGIGRPERR
jgi:hypothetical protein